MKELTVDTVDAFRAENLLFHNNGSEIFSRKFCNSLTVPQSVFFFTQAILVLIFAIDCLFGKTLDQPPCEQQKIWFSPYETRLDTYYRIPIYEQENFHK